MGPPSPLRQRFLDQSEPFDEDSELLFRDEPAEIHAERRGRGSAAGTRQAPSFSGPSASLSCPTSGGDVAVVASRRCPGTALHGRSSHPSIPFVVVAGCRCGASRAAG
eukprot:11381192-Alexandrium_andersonii.AAC.1